MAPIAQLTSSGDDLQAAGGPRTAADLPLAGPGARPRGVYVHVPFCRHKCHYCDFYSVVEPRGRRQAFAARLVEEIGAAAPRLTRPVETVFFGGGTPTLLGADLWAGILAALAEHLPDRAGAGAVECTVEANPETVTEPLLAILVAGGVNRVSVGIQSFQPRHLETLERRHDPAAAARSVELARAAGIDNISLDLIFGIPGQSLDEWLGDLEAALALEPAHLSCYGLTYEPNTPLAARVRAGTIRKLDEDLEAAMYEAAIDRLAEAGFEHYEISNWARPGRRCRHNLLYWLNAQWWPLGPGAAGHVAGWRWSNVAQLDDYLGGGGLPPITGAERLDDDGRAGEELMLGLRLVEGIPLERVDRLLAAGSRGRQRAGAIDRHAGTGLLDRSGGGLRLTRRGLLLADTVLADLI
ncbi:MAG: radical SAM family heme chaperone HemW [Planctomycetota bacterium]